MTSDKERFEFAEKILESVVIEAENEGDDVDEPAPFSVRRPPPLPPELAHLEQHLPRIPNLRYKLDSEFASMDMYFFADGFAIEVLDQCDAMLEKFLDGTTVDDRDGRSHKLCDVVSPESRLLLLGKLTEHTLIRFLYNLKFKIETATDELLADSILIGLASFLERDYDEFKKLGVTNYDTSFIAEEYERVRAEAYAERTEFVEDFLKYHLLPDLEELEEHYRKVLPMWQDAKLLYKQNSNRAAWREIVRAAHPDLCDYNDLISRLSGKLLDLPEEIQAKLSEKGGDSKPSSIALEHAARMCGAEPYEYSVRYLYYKLKKCNSGEAAEQSISPKG